MKEKHSREEYPSAEEKELHVVRNHKDTVFRLLYQNREKLLELYNALNGTASVSYTHLDVYKRQVL